MADRIDEIITHIIDLKTQTSINQQHISDIKDTIAEIREDCPVWEVQQRVEKLEIDQTWYRRIYGVLSGAIGAFLAIIFEWFLSRRS